MNQHFIEKCKECDSIIRQCNCWDANKTIIKKELCEKCKKKKAHNAHFAAMRVKHFK